MLKKQSLSRRIAALEEDKGRIAEIFEHINQAREQLVVRICVIVIISHASLLLPSVQLVTGLRVRKTVLEIQGDLAVIPLLQILFHAHSSNRNYFWSGSKSRIPLITNVS